MEDEVVMKKEIKTYPLLEDIIKRYDFLLNEIKENKVPLPINNYCNDYGTNQYIISDKNFSDDGESYKVIDNLNYKETFLFFKNENYVEEEIENLVISFVIEKVAEYCRNCGFKNKSIKWFLYNYKNYNQENIDVSSWGRYGFIPDKNFSLKENRKRFGEYIQEEYKNITEVLMKFRRADNLSRLREERRVDELINDLLNLGVDPVFRTHEVKNHLDEVVEYEEIDLINKKVKGTAVRCWSSTWLGLGNCQCINHDYSDDYEYDLTSFKLKEILDKIKSDIENKKIIAEEINKLEVKDSVIRIREKYFRDIVSEYVDLDLKELKVIEYHINCYSSSLLDLGTCQCHSHNPTSTFVRDMTIEDIELLRNFLLQKEGKI